MEWFALIIPALSVLVALLWFRDKFVWWEYLLPSCITIVTILICKAGVKTSLVRDEEYWGSLIVEARYYEYWETWVDETCTRSYECGTTDNPQTCTESYDCSYCDHNSEYWEAIDNAGHSYNISKEYYDYLTRKWSCSPQFVGLNRDIDEHGSCGKNGNMYSIKWNNKIETSEAAVRTYDYTNKVQAAHSAFKLPNITDKEAKIKQLYQYPEFYNNYKQKVILGLDTVYSSSDATQIETLFQYFNGKYGSINKIKLFVCIFYDKEYSIGRDQEAYWGGGNQNELVICIGMDKKKNIQWVYPFSWSDKERVLVDCREDIANLKTFKPDSVYLAIESSVINNGEIYKDFKKDFSYLTVELPQWSLRLIWILSIIFTLIVWIWCYRNEFYELN